MINSKYLLVLITLILCSCSENLDLIETTTVADLNGALDTYFDESDISGISLMAIEDENVVYTKSLGYANVEEHVLYDVNSVQNLGSVSKTFLAVALMKAIELNLVDLDEDINTYLPFKLRNPHFPKAIITLEHLATHSSGIIDVEELYSRCYFFENASELDFSSFTSILGEDNISIIEKNVLIDDGEILEQIFSPLGQLYTPASFTKNSPGAHYEYSNLGSALTGYIIEKASDMTYENFVLEYITNPLRMEHVYWSYDEVPAELLANKYYDRDISIPHYHLITRADGGVYTSLNELSKFMIEMANGYKGNGTILSNNSYAKMFNRQEIGKVNTGLFWEINEEGVIRHTGSDPGVLEVVGYNPNKDMCYLLATNCSAEYESSMLQPLKKMFNTMTNHQF